jgi:threonylcarbamoyladenosine tRNA methylthiotransferase MtaB
MKNIDRKVALKTIGCKVNQYETGVIKQTFLKNGFTAVDFREKADIYIINTCAVTREAERKSKQMIRKAGRTNPFATVIVTGCAVQTDLEEIKDCTNTSCHIISNYYKNDIFNIFAKSSINSPKKIIHFIPGVHINQYHENYFPSTSNRIRGLVKIQDGCNQFCSYCVIPYLRGKARSRKVNDILSEIRELIKNRYKEIVLLGINLGSYGEDLETDNINLAKLIKKIEKIHGLERVRLSSIEFPWITDELIDTFNNSSKLCHHLHIPLQSGDDYILSLMRRKYNITIFEEKVKKIMAGIPDIAITTDIIVGFPGEDVLSFQKTYHFLKRIGFSKIHVFPYSERLLTLSSLFTGKNNTEVIKKRVKKLTKLSLKLRKDFFLNNLNQEKTIIIENSYSKNNNKYASCGLTDNYITVCIKGLKKKNGELIKVRLKNAFDSYIEGEEVINQIK